MKINKKIFIVFVFVIGIIFLFSSRTEGFYATCIPSLKLNCKCETNENCGKSQICNEKTKTCIMDPCKGSNPVKCSCSTNNDCKDRNKLFCHTETKTCRKFSDIPCDPKNPSECAPGSFCTTYAPKNKPSVISKLCKSKSQIDNMSNSFIFFGDKYANKSV